MRASLLAAFACLVDLSCAALFSVKANSTCNSAPLYIEGLLVAPLDCIGGVEHSASALLDGNQSTFWQSAMGASNVALSFSNVRPPPKKKIVQANCVFGGGAGGVAGNKGLFHFS